MAKPSRMPLKARQVVVRTKIEAVFGCLVANRAPLSIDDMDAAVRRQALRRRRD